MSKPRPLDSEVLVCPHCSALNHPNTAVCNSCGIRIDTYPEVKRNLLERQEELRQTHLAELEEAARQEVVEGAREARKTFYSQMKWLMITGVALIILLASGFLVVSAIQANRMRQIEGIYQIAGECFASGDLICARDRYQEVLRTFPDYADTRNRLIQVHVSLAGAYQKEGNTNQALSEVEAALALKPGDPQLQKKLFEARLQLAESFEKTAQWERAIELLEKALETRPGDIQLVTRIKGDYDSWIFQTHKNKQFILEMQIRSTKNQKYPIK